MIRLAEVTCKTLFLGYIVDVLVRSNTELLMFEKPCDVVVNVC